MKKELADLLDLLEQRFLEVDPALGGLPDATLARVEEQPHRPNLTREAHHASQPER